MSSASEELDNPLYGDFEDYLDGKLPPARHREVADLLARSAAAREMLEELRTARKWLEGTHWDVPEPSGWPSAGEILARAGWRPAASLPAAKPDRSTGRFAGWLSGWMPWQWNVRSPVWVFGAAASVLLLVGGGLWWWVLSPSAPDELAQSKASETSAPPTSELPAQPGAATARPEDAARPVLPAEAAPVGAAPQKKDPAASVLEAASPEGKSKRSGPSAGSSGTAEDRQRAGALRAPALPTTPPEQMAGQSSVAAAPSAGDETAHKAEAMSAERREARPLAAAPLPEAGAAPSVAGRASGAGATDRARDETKEAPRAKPGSAADAQGAAAPVTALTLRLVVANRRAALTQVATVAREFGGSVRLDGEQVAVTVPAGQVSACAVRLRARVSVATEGETLQVTIRERE
ncbi:hypothetical protein [Chloracidobacterium aggregatum]|uniref:Zinc-finger domain-containing protein n=1 Tax=Chloracidobacterium sp. N TaxID=2821540 RepID=A0ABX8B3N7_9BACT|nr:hypothetical protein [Chloracidobacterium aggregatum]QUV85898.1 hypothetical protein J8C03_13915 [Chloracidobacterium sp. 2]QUV92328.1 hypothetical protein J8C04_15655 [Chloracidobacterium sp. A]QUV95603.1 hypothetical protein J8C05_12280 [Chloracidobacterium sp. N]QUV98826.1 hypothetical protein J8C00_13515 [Chloracidobacterium sp. E]